MTIRRWRNVIAGSIVALAAALTLVPQAAAATGWTLVGWNDLGMHCMDADFSVLAILPPYNNIHAQLIDPTGQLVTNPAGITVTYEAIQDPAGSINSTSAGKTNFWQYVGAIFGVNPPVDQGLQGYDMPGIGNTPQKMAYDAAQQWFTGEAIPITPYDDAHTKNYYPMMRLTARDSSGNVLATTDIVLPVSDEMSCKKCHASGSSAAAQPSAGWVNHSDSEKDYRLNVLLLHDEYQQGNAAYQSALSALHLNPLGLYASATSDNHPVLCASCHPSNALPGFGQPGIEPLTQAIHSRHAGVVDPATNMTLGSSANRNACYSCHPGSETRCLRGAMGSAVAADGSLEMQCQSCHGAMLAVGSAKRQGWLDEPTCQECHTGTATSNSGQIRFTSVFDASGKVRVPASTTFATSPNTPAAGLSLFRFSTGHGGLQCEACHGSTHAILPTSHENDNVQAVEIQGSKGTIADCASCHGTSPSTTTGGPHGMHPIGSAWVSRHDNAAEGNRAACQACHGTDYRGTVLSRSLTDKVVQTSFGTKTFWRGFQIGCYTCHNGPGSESRNSNSAPVTKDLTASTSAGTPVKIALSATDADGNSLQLRVVTQPAHGTVGVSGTQATYFPEAGFSGKSTFTYAAWDGSTDSNLSTVTVTVGSAAPCTVSCSATVPTSGIAGSAVSFKGSATSSCGSPVSYQWSFGDGSSSSSQNPSHSYAAAGTYTWTLTASAAGSSCVKTGSISVTAVTPCSVSCSASVPSGAIAGTAVSFQGSATTSGCDSPVSYVWEFGDGSTSTAQNASHSYASAGSYSWTLTATAGDGSCVKSGTITVSAPTPCTVSCSASVPSSGTAGTAASFRASATTSGCESPVTYVWEFGDGAMSTAQNPSHVYASEGSYSWTLTTTAGTGSCVKSGTISIQAPATCTLSCSAQVSSTAIARSSTEFRAQVEPQGCSGTPSVVWDFGDGSRTASGSDVRHTYSTPGTYTWTMRSSLSSAHCQTSGTITVSGRVSRRIHRDH